jgi:hypothetical protein
MSSEELRQKVVQAVERGMPKYGVARLLDISPSSDRRFARTARRRESLAPKREADPQKVDHSTDGLLE